MDILTRKLTLELALVFASLCPCQYIIQVSKTMKYFTPKIQSIIFASNCFAFPRKLTNSFFMDGLLDDKFYHIICGVIQEFPALRIAVTTHVKKYRIFSRVLI